MSGTWAYQQISVGIQHNGVKYHKYRNFRLQALSLYLRLQPRDKAAMLGVNTREFFLEE